MTKFGSDELQTGCVAEPPRWAGGGMLGKAGIQHAHTMPCPAVQQKGGHTPSVLLLNLPGLPTATRMPTRPSGLGVKGLHTWLSLLLPLPHHVPAWSVLLPTLSLHPEELPPILSSLLTFCLPCKFLLGDFTLLPHSPAFSLLMSSLKKVGIDDVSGDGSPTQG